MKKTAVTILSVLAFIGGFLIFYQSRLVAQKTPVTPETSQRTNSSQKWDTKTDERANVTVTVAPSDLGMESREWKFDIVISTHSVELDQDMTRVVALIDDSGKEYSPLRWEGAPAGGHHREGVLIFDPITPYPQHLKLYIKDIGDAQRLFSWILTE